MSFFSLPDWERAEYDIPKFVATSPGEYGCQKYGAQLQNIAWKDDFKNKYGIMDYTRKFIDTHANLIVVRHTVGAFWIAAVTKI